MIRTILFGAMVIVVWSSPDLRDSTANARRMTAAWIDPEDAPKKNPKDYKNIQKSIDGGGVDEKNRLKLAGKAFDHCASYDRAISTELQDAALHLRYGENPHQNAFVLKERHDSFGLPQAKQVQGKEMSYNNFLDGDAALLCLSLIHI